MWHFTGKQAKNSQPQNRISTIFKKNREFKKNFTFIQTDAIL